MIHLRVIFGATFVCSGLASFEGGVSTDLAAAAFMGVGVRGSEAAVFLGGVLAAAAFIEVGLQGFEAAAVLGTFLLAAFFIAVFRLGVVAFLLGPTSPA